MPWAPNSVGRCTKQASLEEAAAGELVACMARTEGSVCDTSSHPQGAPENPSAQLQGLSHSLPAAWHVLKPLAPLQFPENPSGPLRAGAPHLPNLENLGRLQKKGQAPQHLAPSWASQAHVKSQDLHNCLPGKPGKRRSLLRLPACLCSFTQWVPLLLPL